MNDIYRVPSWSRRPRFADVEPLLKPAQVLLVQHRGPLGFLIRRVTKSWATHAAMICQDTSGVWTVLEAVAQGVVGHRLEHYFESPAITRILIRDFRTPTVFSRPRAIQHFWLHVGQRYNQVGLLGVYARRRLGLPVALTRHLDDQHREFCSEGVVDAIDEGYRGALLPGLPHNQTAPGDLVTAELLVDIWAWPVPLGL